MHTPLAYEVTPDADEFTRGTLHIQRRNRFVRLLWPFWLLCVLAFAFAVIRGAEPGTIVWLLVLVVMFPGSRVLTRWQMRRTWRRHLAETPGLDGPQLYEFMDNGVSIRNRISSTLLGWDAVVEAEETPEFFPIYPSKMMGYLIPKRVVGGAADEDALRAVLREHLGPRAAKLR